MPDRLIATIWSHDSSETLWKLRFGLLMPALFTRMSIWPRRLRIACAVFATSFWSDTSMAMTSASPAAFSSFSAFFSVSALRPETTTCAPARANSSAPARPMPEPPPVIQATLPLNVLGCAKEIFLLFLGHFTCAPRVLQYVERALHRGTLEDRVAPL